MDVMVNEKDVIARTLYADQPLYWTERDSGVYHWHGVLRGTPNALVVISLLADAETEAGPAGIFARMLPKVPQQDSTVLYTERSTVTIFELGLLPNALHILLCGVTVRDQDCPLNRNARVGDKQVLCVPGIQEIDAGPDLKKTMWQEWMKQFAA